MSVLYAMPVAASRSISPYVVNNHHRNRLSCPTLALQCVSFVPIKTFTTSGFIRRSIGIASLISIK